MKSVQFCGKYGFSLVAQILRRNDKWKELTNPKRDKEARFMASEQEWRQRAEEESWQEEETRVVISCLPDTATVAGYGK